MKLSLVSISANRAAKRQDPAALLTLDYASRIAAMSPFETAAHGTEAALFQAIDRQGGRTPTQICLFDSSGDALTSAEFAQYLARVRDGGTQRMVLAVGPASGWSEASLRRGHRILSLGRMTLPHELARAVVAEQIYRALTILAGHPYHLGH